MNESYTDVQMINCRLETNVLLLFFKNFVAEVFKSYIIFQ